MVIHQAVSWTICPTTHVPTVLTSHPCLVFWLPLYNIGQPLCPQGLCTNCSALHFLCSPGSVLISLLHRPLPVETQHPFPEGTRKSLFKIVNCHQFLRFLFSPFKHFVMPETVFFLLVILCQSTRYVRLGIFVSLSTTHFFLQTCPSSARRPVPGTKINC